MADLSKVTIFWAYYQKKLTTGSIEEINLIGAKMAVVMRESKRLFSWGGKSKTIIKSNTL